MEFLFEYGLFLAKAVTLVIAIAVTLGLILSLIMKHSGKGEGKGELKIVSISDNLKDMQTFAQQSLLSNEERKAFVKAEKKKAKAEKKTKKTNDNDQDTKAHKVFVIDFNGSMQAEEVEALRREVTAILSVAIKDDEVVVRLESGGGVVHGYGLAAAQLQRIKDAEVSLTVTIDKVAASGGYMMACVADKIISANFAIIGSIGVVAQIPNIHKLLKKNDIDIEMHTAGEYKRTLTLLGKNTDEGREKFKAELEAVHVMFKDFVANNRPDLDISKVATGEYWYGLDALKLGLVDALSTSDDVLLELNKSHHVYKVSYTEKKNLAEKLGLAAESSVLRIVQKVLQTTPRPSV